MDKINTILFDIGNVLIRFDHFAISESLAKYAYRGPDEIYELVFKKGIVLDYDKGKISSRDFYDSLIKTIGLHADFSLFRDLWCESFYENKSIIKIAAQLKKSFNVAILSDTNHLHFSFMIRNFHVLRIFKKFFLSYKLKTVKSEKIVYSKILCNLGLEPSRILYIDDRKDLTEIAKNLGYNTIKFTNTSRLKKDLLQYRIYRNE
jgi:glucose-1-phosphatase